MTDRCWRKSISVNAATRELYPTDLFGDNAFVVPSCTSIFQVTIPEGTFAPATGNVVLGAFKCRASYAFSQRRTDIQDVAVQYARA